MDNELHYCERYPNECRDLPDGPASNVFIGIVLLIVCVFIYGVIKTKVK